jgi:peptidoglycan/xylan/chitin deacetylase (PgdA/CDA1 family)
VTTPRLAFKVDVDTERGTREGVPALARSLEAVGAPASFLFSLGPDNTGRALKRVFRPGFLEKVGRTNVVGTYGLRTLGNGVLWPGPRIARRHGDLLRAVRDSGFEVGIHCWDHIRWQDGLAGMSAKQTAAEFDKARVAFRDVFGGEARCAGAAGWQANAASLAAYDAAGLRWASDARGRSPFRPRCGGHVFATPQIPTTLPTLDELLGLPEHPEEGLVDQYVGWLRADALNVLTIHAELEGMAQRAWFERLLAALRGAGIAFVALAEEAERLRADLACLPVGDLAVGTVPGRSGTLAVQA